MKFDDLQKMQQKNSEYNANDDDDEFLQKLIQNSTKKTRSIAEKNKSAYLEETKNV